MTTAQLSVQYASNGLASSFAIERIEEQFDVGLWQQMESITPASADSLAAPVVRWAFISRTSTIVIEPLAGTNGLRVCRMPSFSRTEVYPVCFGFPPRLETEFESEAEELFIEATRAEVAAGRSSPEKGDPLLRAMIIRRIWERHHTVEENKRWLQASGGVGHRLVMGRHFQGGIFERDLNRIAYRADFYVNDGQEPTSVLCATCEERVTSVADARTLPAEAPDLSTGFNDLVARLGCKPATLRHYSRTLGFGKVNKFSLAQVAEIVTHRQNLRQRHHLKTENRTRHAHPPKPRGNYES